MIITNEEIFIRLIVAAALGMIIGIEREAKNKPAGLRTFTLVSLGSAGFSLIVISIIEEFLAIDSDLKIDPSRVIQGVIDGIGFLGAGAIIQSQGQIRGMTTGAGIWTAGAIGLASGFGLFWLASMMTGIILFILIVLGFLNRNSNETEPKKQD